MIKVFFDHQKFTTQRFGGISRYFASLIDAIKNSADFDYKLGLLYSNNHYIKDEKLLLNNAVGRRLLRSEYGGRSAYVNEKYCRYLLKEDKFSVFHPTYYDLYSIGLNKRPMVTTVHDMTYERLPEYFWANDPLPYNKRISMEKADRIIAISETTKKDILELTGINEDKIQVIYHGIDIRSELSLESVRNLPSNYLLFVGDRSGYKNFYLFIDAFSKIKDAYPEIDVVLTGGGSLGHGDREFLHRTNLSGRVHHVNVSDEQLNYLYKHALLFVYPSLYEGFGLPILEAFKAQCPVLLSDIDCFKEVGADAVAYFEKLNIDHLVYMLEMLINDDSARRNLVLKGEERLKNFPIETCTEKTLDIYRELIF